jgi:hypothetical protein
LFKKFLHVNNRDDNHREIQNFSASSYSNSIAAGLGGGEIIKTITLPGNDVFGKGAANTKCLGLKSR